MIHYFQDPVVKPTIMNNGEGHQPLIINETLESRVVDMPSEEQSAQVNKKTVFGYSLGHVFNDMCASMWFTYLLLYLEKVVKMISWRAGLLMLIGQATDAVATPIIGLISDSRILPHSVVKYGQRMPWHFVGFILVACSFPFVFNECLLCDSTTKEVWEVVYYIPLIMAFQIGWASVQVNHLALIQTITTQESCRRTLSSSRLAAAVVANVTVYTVLYLFFRYDRGDELIGPADLSHFRNLALIVVAVGVVITLSFYYMIHDPPPEHYGVQDFVPASNTIGPCDYLKMPRFYTIGLIYMLSRLYGNFSQVYFPLYLTMTLGMGKLYLGLLPLLSYLFAFAVYSITTSRCVHDRIGKGALLLCGGIMAIITTILLYLPLPQWTVFITAATLGIAQSMFLTSAFNFCHFLADKDAGSSAFIYGSMSFVDKLSNGIIFQIIEIINPSCNPNVDHKECAIFYRNIMVYIPGACALILIVFALYLVFRGLRIVSRQQNNQRLLLEENIDTD